MLDNIGFWRLLVLAISLGLIIIGVVYFTSVPRALPSLDIPEFGADEVEVIVKEQILDSPGSLSVVRIWQIGDAKYVGNGKWTGEAYVLAYKTPTSILPPANCYLDWNFYETSRTVTYSERKTVILWKILRKTTYLTIHPTLRGFISGHLAYCCPLLVSLS